MIAVTAKTPHPLLNKDGKSLPYLGVVKTPSTTFFDIVHYDVAYKKDSPWRNRYNHPVTVTHYQALPDLPE